MLTQIGFLALMASSAIAAPVAQQQGYGALPVGADASSVAPPAMQMPPMGSGASAQDSGALASDAGASPIDSGAPGAESDVKPLDTSVAPGTGAGGQPLCGTEPYDPNAYTCSPLKARGPPPPGVPANAALTKGHILCHKPYKACGYDCYQEGTLYGCTDDGTTLYQLAVGPASAGTGQSAGGPALIPSGEKPEEIQAPYSAGPPTDSGPGSINWATLQIPRQGGNAGADASAPGSVYGAQGSDALPPYPVGPGSATPPQVPGTAMPSGAVQLTPEMINSILGSAPEAANPQSGSGQGSAAPQYGKPDGSSAGSPSSPPAGNPDGSAAAGDEPVFPPSTKPDGSAAAPPSGPAQPTKPDGSATGSAGSADDFESAAGDLGTGAAPGYAPPPNQPPPSAASPPAGPPAKPAV